MREVPDTLDQFDRALEVGPDIILIDNLGPELLAEAVRRRDERAPGILLEASGGVNLATVGALARRLPAPQLALRLQDRGRALHRGGQQSARAPLSAPFSQGRSHQAHANEHDGPRGGLRHGGDVAEQPMVLRPDTGGEEEFVGGTTVAAAAKLKSP